jgi:hypothetical protein
MFIPDHRIRIFSFLELGTGSRIHGKKSTGSRTRIRNTASYLPYLPFSGGSGARPRNGVNSASLVGYGQQAGFGRGDTADNSNSSRQQQEEWNRRFSKQGGWEAVQSATQAVSRLACSDKFLCRFGPGFNWCRFGAAQAANSVKLLI